eukprot:CCRYP_006145-RA/>CCRYP_006145-RA protein AED:0.47 eAED:0.41 QI:0/0/0/0.5/1/1/2/0/578
MITSKAVPDGLKSQECERNLGQNKPPVPYIPERDVVQDALAVDTTASTMKLTLPGKVELRVSVWSHGTPEQFLMHVQAALDAVRQKGLDVAFDRVCKDQKVCIKKATKDEEAFKSYSGSDVNPPEEKAYEKALEATTKADKAVTSVINQVFSLYSNLLTEEARRPWKKIVSEQIDCSPWTDIYGEEHPEKREQSWGSFMECVSFHLLTVFRNDAAETQRFYISNGLKKPNRVPIRQFISRIQQLNGYLDLLPCLYYSNRATKLTTAVKPFDDPDLASHILRMVPRNWQDQYELSGASVPQSVRKLLEALERIEKAYPTNKDRDGPKGSGKRCLRLRIESRVSVPQVQSTAFCARSMGARTRPIIRRSATRLYRKKAPWTFTWSGGFSVHQIAFDNVKAAIAKDVVLAYPNFSKEFEIYTDASSKQLGSVIIQGNTPLTFFSRKLSTEIELLAIVETLKEFKGILWGQQIKVYTDHKNLIQDALGLTSDQVYRWRLLLEEYGPKIVHIKGIHNTFADAISRLDSGPTQDDNANWMTFTKCWCHYTEHASSAESTSDHQESINLVFANPQQRRCNLPINS